MISGALKLIFSDFRGAEIDFFRFQGVTRFLLISGASRCRTEILKLKELPNDGFETSRGALWFGIGMFFWF